MIDMIFAGLGLGFAPFGIWLTLRIINRRERWAVWAAVALFAVAVAYPLSFGPACWIGSRNHIHSSGQVVSAIYRPVIRAWLSSPQPLKSAGYYYIGIGMPGQSHCAHIKDSRITFLCIENGRIEYY